MRYIAHISLITLFVISVGCNTTKKSVQSTEVNIDSVAKVDSVAKAAETKVSGSNDTFRSRTERDTAVGIGAKSVKDSVQAKDMELARTKDGKAVPRKWGKMENGVWLYAMLDTFGNLTYGCDVDSITLVIKGLIRDSINIHNRYDSLASLYERSASKQHTASTHASTKETTIVKTPTWWGRNWRLIVGGVVIVIILLIVGYIYRYLKGFGS